MSGHVATATTTVEAEPATVWHAITDPETIAKYMYGAITETDWQPGSPIVWKGEWEGKPYEDKGEVLEVVENERLRVTHFSPLTGQDDVPENYHVVQYELAASDDGGTQVTLTQDGNASEEEAEQSAQNWQQFLDGMKSVVEGSG